MSKRIITLGLLVGVLSLNSCVKDNESDAVQAQRQAQTEKLKAEASKLMAEKGLAEAQVKVQEALAKVEEANAKVAEEKAAFDKATHDLEIAQKTKENEAALVRAEKKLEKAKYQLEKMKQTAAKELEELKLTIIKDKDSVAQAMENYKGEKLQAVKDKYEDYIKAVEALEAAQKEVFTLETKVNYAELDAENAKKAKEAEVERYKMLIAESEEMIKSLQTVDYDLKSQVGESFKKYELENELRKVKKDEAAFASESYESVYKRFRVWRNRRDDFKFYAALDRLGYISWHFGVPVISDPDYNASNEVMTKDGQTVNHVVFEETLPSLDTNKFNVVVNRINKRIEELEQDLETAKTNKTNAYDDMVAKKEAYDADTDDANKESEYLTALATYKSRTNDVENVENNLAEVKGQKEEFQANKAIFLDTDNQKEVKAKLAELNELSVKKAETELAYKIQEAKTQKAEDKYNTFSSLLRNRNYYTAQDAIKDSKKDIERYQSYINDLSNVKTKEALVEHAKARLEEKKAEVEILKKEVEFAKKAYEDALAAL